MAEGARPPRIVAELGRPETPDETAARKAESSRRHRTNQTLRNLVLALVASLAIVLFIVLVIVRPDQPTRAAVDYKVTAEQYQPGVSEKLIAPDLPKGWTANDAGLDTGSDDIRTWSIGFLTPSGQYIGFTQGIGANATWLSNQVEQARSTGEVTVADADWKVYDRRDTKDAGNFAYSMTHEAADTGLALHGTATQKEFHTLAAAVTAELEAGTQ
ncbi:MAG: hypothetical protein JWO10_714 [Microbacteriaceae bacterium]|nr:hypothetical protein [Microbacteriaceae bacterium]